MIIKPKKHGRLALLLILTAVIALACSVNAIAVKSPAKQTTYRTVTEIYDWGAAIPRIIVDLGNSVKQGSVSKDTFKVFVSRSDTRMATPLLGEGYRKVTKAYISDKNGKSAATGRYAVLEMEVGPDVTLSLPLNYYNDRNVWINCDYTVTQTKDIVSGKCKISGLVADKCAGGVKKLVDNFLFGKATYDGKTLTYAHYIPAKDNKKNPLIIWLHGSGEGGTDATIPLSANKSVNFSTEKIQSYFGGAYVLVPQTPGDWGDGFTKLEDGTSIYEKSLMALIQNYISQNKDIDQNRIYIGGCSNGGYMTMLMIRDYPGYFAAAFPACGNLKDSLITDEDIQKIKETPIWLVAAKTDTGVPPESFEIPTYNRIIKAGAQDAHFTLFDDVHDTTGLYKNADGTPYEYVGHFSWIYVYNNECEEMINGKATTIMEWLTSKLLIKR
ncbi:MAG TPA: prolyl oligopeptidase family serine peptidase [Ruminiclostridium sp.]|nr:prolyl oligopeptidase family serine peptidase [Ruminiclostridium sp.]